MDLPMRADRSGPTVAGFLGVGAGVGVEEDY